MPARIDGAAAAIGIAAYSSGTGPLRGLWLERGWLAADAGVAALLRLHLHHNRLRMAMLTAEPARIATAMAEQGLRPVLLKGLHTAHGYFPEAGARPVSDVDLLVDPGEDTMAAAVLTALGYVPGRPGRGIPAQRDWRRPETGTAPRTLSFVHYQDPWSIDVQGSLNRRYAPGARGHNPGRSAPPPPSCPRRGRPADLHPTPAAPRLRGNNRARYAGP